MILSIDSFFENPYDIREIAISKFEKECECIINDTNDFYPGIRTSVPKKIEEIIIKYLSNILKKKIIKFSSFFHITSKIHEFGLAHHDNDKCGGVIYLNPNPPPKTGTILFHNVDCDTIHELHTQILKSIYDDFDSEKLYFKEACTTRDIKTIKKYASFKKEFSKNFEIDIIKENVFNRLITYEAVNLHAPHHYFGDTIYNSRLVLVFWYDVSDFHYY